jgi:hypothetical protein
MWDEVRPLVERETHGLDTAFAEASPEEATQALYESYKEQELRAAYERLDVMDLRTELRSKGVPLESAALEGNRTELVARLIAIEMPEKVKNLQRWQQTPKAGLWKLDPGSVDFLAEEIKKVEKMKGVYTLGISSRSEIQRDLEQLVKEANRGNEKAIGLLRMITDATQMDRARKSADAEAYEKACKLWPTQQARPKKPKERTWKLDPGSAYFLAEQIKKAEKNKGVSTFGIKSADTLHRHLELLVKQANQGNEKAMKLLREITDATKMERAKSIADAAKRSGREKPINLGLVEHFKEVAHKKTLE